MQVREIMTKDVDTVQPDTPVATVACIFRERAISGMPVVDDEERLVGIVSHTDLLHTIEQAEAAEGVPEGALQGDAEP